MGADLVRDKILGYILDCDIEDFDDELFTEFALELADVQYRTSRVVRALYERLGSPKPEMMSDWSEIPTMSVTQFKHEPPKCYEGASVKVWSSSGTTGSRPSMTPLGSTKHYRAAIKREEDLFHRPGNWPLALIPFSGAWPQSSLAYMFEQIFGSMHRLSMVYQSARFQIDEEQAKLLLGIPHEEPVTIYGTSYGFVMLYDLMRDLNMFVKLPEGSMLIDTGGFKGITRAVPRDQMLKLGEELLGVPAEDQVNEYGMSELSSQFWQHGTRAYRQPPWVRVRAVDPLTREDRQDGAIAVYDLANVWSYMALQTEDQGVVTQDGFLSHVTGRIPGAVAKGCSLTTERLS